MLKALLFDLDGVLTDTAEAHYQSWQRLADEEGWPFTRAANEQLRGLTRPASLAVVRGTHAGDEADIERWLARKNDYFLEEITHGGLALLPGIAALLDEAETAGLRSAVASSSRNARTLLSGLGVTHRFAAIIEGDAVALGKPAPDLFLAAAAALGVAPDEVVVIEDAESGIAAARAAGMAVVGVGPAARVGNAHRRVATTSALSLAALRAAHQDAAMG